jgi:hypothetical protein
MWSEGSCAPTPPACRRCFGVFSDIVTGFIFGGLTGVLASLGGGSGVSDERMLKMLSIKAWMKSKAVSRADRANILAHVESQISAGATFSAGEILDDLPPALASEIAYHLYGRALGVRAEPEIHRVDPQLLS